MEMETKKVISVTREQRDFLLRTFGVSEQMLSYALNYNEKKGHSDLAKRIRRLALQRGGFVLCTLPASEVVHDADGMMRQWFSNGMMWECNKLTCELEVRDCDGKVVERMENVTLPDIEAMQARVSAM